MGVVNTTPTGLLDLLAAKTGGKMPNNMSETLQPVLSLDQFLVNKKLAVELSSYSATAVGTADSITVPAGELWALVAIGFTFSSTVIGDSIGLHWTVNNLPASDTPGDGGIIWSPGKVISDAAQQFGSAIFFPYPILLSPGANLSSVVISKSATRTVNWSVTFNRYKV